MPMHSTAQGHLRAFIKLNLTEVENNTIHAHFTNVKHIYKHNPKVSPFGVALIKKWQIKLGDAGTIDHFGLAFQYQIKKYIKRNGQKQS